MWSAAILAAREAGIALKQQAVLFRASHHSGALELELARRNIPFVKFGGLKFLEASHVKDVIGLLRWAENPRDRVAGFRSLHLLPGVGPATARKALDHLESAGFALDALARLQDAARRRGGLAGVGRPAGAARRPGGGLVRPARPGEGMVSAPARAAL